MERTMKYWLTVVLFLLVLPPVFGQELSPIVIETGNPTPSAVRTGEPFKVTYRAKFYDQVLIVEDQMRPENIMADKFEVLKLESIALPDQGDQDTGIIHVRDFIYTFRIIKPDKGDVKIPAFKFIWVVKKAGTTEDNAQQANELREMLTDEVGVRYVYSPVRPPNLNIRDEINLSLFSISGTQLRRYAYGVIIVFSTLSLLALVRFYRLPGIQKVSINKSSDIATDVAVAEAADNTSSKRARKKFLRELKKLSESKNLDVDLITLEAKVYMLLREFLLVELSGSPVGALKSDTPRELFGRVDSLSPKHRSVLGKKYKILVTLVDKLVGYYQDMESGALVNFSKPKSEIQLLRDAVERTSLGGRFWKALGIGRLYA
jgi:hypothetical protein